MTIEKHLDRIATALEQIASGASTPAASSSKSTAQSEKKSGSSSTSSKKSSAKSSDGPSKDDVRAALKALQKAKGAAAARDLLAENDAKTLTDLKTDYYYSVIESAEERANG